MDNITSSPSFPFREISALASAFNNRVVNAATNETKTIHFTDQITRPRKRNANAMAMAKKMEQKLHPIKIRLPFLI